MAKKITLPIGNKLIFDALGKIALKAEKKKPKNEQQFIDEIGFELAEEAFLFSFTPSGEIGDNPVRKSDAEIFLKSFDSLFSKRFGSIAGAMDGEPKSKINNAIRKVKSALVEIASVYTKEMFPTPAKSKKARTGDIDADVQEEIEKYFNLFVTALIFHETANIFSIEPVDILRAIKRFNMLGINDAMTAREKLKILKSSENKKKFIEKVKNIK